MRVYKFSSLTGPRFHHVKDTLTRGEIHFCPPKALNDPFEYTCKLVTDNVDVGSAINRLGGRLESQRIELCL